MQYGYPDTWQHTLVASLATAAGGYLLESWQKAKPADALPVAAEGLGFVATAFAHRFVRHPLLSEVAEGLQYGTAWGLGRWAADITTTIGDHAPGAPAPWMPGVAAATSPVLPVPNRSDIGLVTPLPPTAAVTQPYRYTRRQVAY